MANNPQAPKFEYSFSQVINIFVLLVGFIITYILNDTKERIKVIEQNQKEVLDRVNGSLNKLTELDTRIRVVESNTK